MRLLERIDTWSRLDRPGYVAMTCNGKGCVTADGETPEDAAVNLVNAVRALRTPPAVFPDKFGPRTAQEWYAEKGDWFL